MSQPPPRRSSLGMLLRRSKSGDLGKGQRKASKEQPAVSKTPPKLPEFVGTLDDKNPHTFPSFDPDARSILSGSTDLYSARPSIEPRLSSDTRTSLDPGRVPLPSIPIPPIPETPTGVQGPTESMTHRGRFSYASSALSTVNNPRRVRRRKDPTPFNVLVVGSSGSGKTSFLEFLKTALALPPIKRSRKTVHEDNALAMRNRLVPCGNFVPHYLETEIDHEHVGLTLWDSEGLEKNVVDLQLREMNSFLESKFKETFEEETKVLRSPVVLDTHIHAVFLILDPARLDRNLQSAKNSAAAFGLGAGFAPLRASARAPGVLDEDLDLQLLRALQGKTIVIPVIAKADTVTAKHMAVLKRSVWDTLKQADLNPLETLGMDDDDEDSAIDTSRTEDAASAAAASAGRDDDDTRTIRTDVAIDDSASSRAATPTPMPPSPGSVRRHNPRDGAGEHDAAAAAGLPFLPLSIISPDIYEPHVVGRRFPWGFADPYNDDHCDFVKLKDTVFGEWRTDLREASRDHWYEGWRTNKLNNDPAAGLLFGSKRG